MEEGCTATAALSGPCISASSISVRIAAAALGDTADGPSLSVTMHDLDLTYILMRACKADYSATRSRILSCTSRRARIGGVQSRPDPAGRGVVDAPRYRPELRHLRMHATARSPYDQHRLARKV